ncbi:MAG: hypothetical protein ACPGWR_33440, partial [Ardenticatenaceae bacterium]
VLVGIFAGLKNNLDIFTEKFAVFNAKNCCFHPKNLLFSSSKFAVFITKNGRFSSFVSASFLFSVGFESSAATHE